MLLFELGADMQRRQFMTLVGGAVTSWPLVARAHQATVPVIGYLSTGSSQSDAVTFLPAFRKGLGEFGFVEGQNVEIDYRWADFQYERLPSMVADLAQRQVSAIAAIGGTPPALVAKAATSSIPIVFYLGIDPVQFGLVASLNHPGKNITGVAALQADLIAKRIEVLHELVPKAADVALLVNPSNRYTETETRVLDESARSLGLQLQVLRAASVNEIDVALGTVVGSKVDALLVSADLFLLSQHKQIAELATRRGLPAMYPWREYVAAGGLMCYGPSLFDAYHLVGVYIGRILKGAKPADMPVEQTTKVEFVINPKTAKKLGLSFPITLLGRADEVIE
jgi:putative tryptophan/tyrosine transport system substrate-binding protein